MRDFEKDDQEMRKLTDMDMVSLAGAVIADHKVEGVRIKRSAFSDSDHYGIILGRSLSSGKYVTWQFHLDEDEKPTLYWGHYFMDNREAAIDDFNSRDLSA